MDNKRLIPRYSFTVVIHVLPEISWLTLALRKGPLVFLKSWAVAVIETLVCSWTFWIIPLKQKSPTENPSVSATWSEKDWLHSWPGIDCCKLPVGDTRSSVPSRGMLRCHVKLWRGIGRQESSLGTVRTDEGHDATFWHPVIKRQWEGNVWKEHEMDTLCDLQ